MSDSDWEELNHVDEGEEDSLSSSYDEPCTGQHNKECQECTEINIQRLVAIRNRLASNLNKVSEHLDSLDDTESSCNISVVHILVIGVIARVALSFI